MFKGVIFINFFSKLNNIVASVSGILGILTIFIPSSLTPSIKLILVLILFIFNLLFYFCTAIKELKQLNKNYKELESEYNILITSNNELKKKHEALAEQFTTKNNNIDDLENKLSSYSLLFTNVNSILHYFIAQPSAQEVNCIEKIIKYLNDNHIKE